MKRYFSEKALLQIREEIEDAGGNEVFFLGRTDEARIVVEVEALARGNRDAVAAVMISVSFGDVVIHNHPTGNLTPSGADMEIAALLGNQGVGFYIVDNSAEHCYQAVAPFVRREASLLSFPEIERFFADGGILAERLPGYEHRDEQTRMAFAVAEALNGNKVAVIEAGTGTGKSLAYLLPSVYWAIRNKERVVVSTNTINLQEQLTKKDIPFLQKHGGLQFRAVLVKGRGNYLCLRKVETVRSEPSLFADDPSVSELQAIVAWSEKTGEGCRSDLSFIPKDDVWEEVCCEADQCGRVKCPHYARCFFYTARREAATADLLVVNHALLLADAALRQETGNAGTAILPPFDRLIFDEGHHLEDVATSHLSSQISRQGILKTLGRLQNPRKAQRGLLPLLSGRLSREVPESHDDLYMEVAAILEGELIPRWTPLADSAGRVMDDIGLALLSHLQAKEEKGGERKLRVVPSLYGEPFWQRVEERLGELCRNMTDYSAALNRFLKATRRLPEDVLNRLSGPLVDLKGVAGRIDSLVTSLRFFIARDEGVCRWFEVARGQKGMKVRLCSSPLEVAGAIKSVILDKIKSVVLTSATLAVGERFDFLKERTGINLLPRDQVIELLLASPFDYERQAFVGIPSDLPEPTGPAFEQALVEHLPRSLGISQGRAFVLFTSYDLLTRVYRRIGPRLEQLGLTPMRQGEMNRHLLLNRFRKEKNSVLFGTDSFWEGVDVQGRALELVIITRLPFRVPTEPILEARAEHIASTGGDPFMAYTVPQAVIKFKQGFGRLIRSRDDRGAVLILDSRVLSRNYGRHFLRSLPPVALATGSEAEVLGGMTDFFSQAP